MIDPMQRLRAGDVLRNDWASDDNPQKYTMYLKRGKLGNYKTFQCIAYDGCICHHEISNNRLEVVGHINEYDDYMAALRRLYEVSK